MKVKVNLSNQTLEYMDSQPYIQGTDTRNRLNVYIEHSTIPQTEGAFNIQIAYALQNGRTTIKMANTGATTETIDDVLYDIFYFTAPSVLTSVAGNFVATLILKVNSNLYKVNVLNTVLNAVEFEAFEDALDDVSSQFIETIEDMAEDITGLQTNVNTLNTLIVPVDTYGAYIQSLDHKTIMTSFKESGNNKLYLFGRNGNNIYPVFTTTNANDTQLYSYYGANRTELKVDAQNNKVVLTQNGNDTAHFYEGTYQMARQTYVDTKYNLIMNNIVELSGTSGTLTSTQLEILNHTTTNVGLIVLGVDVYTLYGADENNVNIMYYATFKTAVSDNVLTLNKKVISINLTSGAWELITTSTDLPNTTITTGLQSQITAIKNEVGYIEVNGESGTLTNEQYAECLKPYCIIKLTSGIYSYTYIKYIENSQSIFFAMYEQNESKGTYYIMHRKGISIGKNTSPKRYEVNDAPIYYYNMNQIDTKTTNLQSQIDGINAGQNLADIVADLTALGNLDTSKLQSGDKVEVLSDSNHDNVSTVYNWNGTIWQYIGAYGTDSYTKAQMDSALATKQNVIDSSHKLDADLVDDTNATNKFVTASEKAQITTNQNAIAGIKDGTNLDSFSDVETALAGKQDTLSGSTSIDITSNVVSVNDSYVENFFATDLEVQNMLEEVFA